MKQRPHLTLVKAGFARLAQREQLIARAKILFPGDDKPTEARRNKWVEAKMLLGNTQPKVCIGTNEPAVFRRHLPGAKF